MHLLCCFVSRYNDFIDFYYEYYKVKDGMSQSQWPHGLRRGSATVHLLRFRVRSPPGAWMFVCCEYCVLSSRDLSNELITRPEESYRLWCV